MMRFVGEFIKQTNTFFSWINRLGVEDPQKETIILNKSYADIYLTHNEDGDVTSVRVYDYTTQTSGQKNTPIRFDSLEAFESQKGYYFSQADAWEVRIFDEAYPLQVLRTECSTWLPINQAPINQAEEELTSFSSWQACQAHLNQQDPFKQYRVYDIGDKPKVLQLQEKQSNAKQESVLNQRARINIKKGAVALFGAVALYGNNLQTNDEVNIETSSDGFVPTGSNNTAFDWSSPSWKDVSTIGDSALRFIYDSSLLTQIVQPTVSIATWLSVAYVMQNAMLPTRSKTIQSTKSISPILKTMTSFLSLNLFSVVADGAGCLMAEKRVNTYTDNFQRSPQAAVLTNGHFVVVWMSDRQDGSDGGIYAQRYNELAVVQGSEFRVNTYTTSGQQEPQIAALNNGHFVVVWKSYGQDGSGEGVYAQRYNEFAVAQGSEFRVNTYTATNQENPQIAALNNGHFVVVWQSLFQDGSSGSIHAQRYNELAVVQGSDFRVNTYTTSGQQEPQIAALNNGHFVVVWKSYGQDGSSFGIYAQCYSELGVAQGSEFRVNTYTVGQQEEPQIAALNNGHFVVVWRSYQQGSYAIYAQRYNELGAAQGSEMRVNDNGSPRYPDIAGLSDGHFVIKWWSQNSIYLQRFNALGVAQGEASQANINTVSYNAASVSTIKDDDFVVLWRGDNDVYMRPYMSSLFPQVIGFEDAIYYQQDFSISIAPFSLDGYSWMRANVSFALEPPEMGVLVLSNVNSSLYDYNQTAGVLKLKPDLFFSTLTPIFAQQPLQVISDASQALSLHASFSFEERQENKTLLLKEVQPEDHRFNGVVSGVQSYPGAMHLSSNHTQFFWHTALGHDCSGIHTIAIDSVGRLLSNEYALFPTGSFAQGVQLLSGNTLMVFNQNPQKAGLKGQIISSDGKIVGASFKIDSLVEHSYFSSLAKQSNGMISLVYSDAKDIYFRSLGFDGETLGTKITLNAHTFDVQAKPVMTLLSNDAHFVVWQSAWQDGDKNGIFAKVLNDLGEVRVLDFQVNSYVFGNQQLPTITRLFDDRVFVTWESEGQDGDGYGIYGRLFEKSSSKIGNEFRVSTTTAGDQTNPVAITLTDGNILVAWQSKGGQDIGSDIRGQLLTPDGVLFGGEMVLNPYRAGDQQHPFLLELSDGRYQVLWDGEGVRDKDGIFYETYHVPFFVAGKDVLVKDYSASPQTSLSALQVYSSPIEPVQVSITQSDVSSGLLSHVEVSSLKLNATQFSGFWSVTGSKADVNAMLKQLYFEPSDGYHDDSYLYISCTNFNETSVGTITLSSVVNRAPVVGAVISNVAIGVGQALVNTFSDNTFFDPDKDDKFTYSAQLRVGQSNEPLEPWMDFAADTRTLSGIPTKAYAGAKQVIVIVSDGYDGLANTTFTLTVNPSLSSSGFTQSSAFVEDAVSFGFASPLTIQTPSAKTTVTMTLSDQHAGSFNTPTVSGTQSIFGGGSWQVTGNKANVDAILTQLQFTPAKDYDKNFQVTSYISDELNYPLTPQVMELTVTAVNDKPFVATQLSAETADVGQQYSITIPSSAFGDADEDTLKLSADYSAAWLKQQGVGNDLILSGTPAKLDEKDYTITITADDDNLSVKQSFTLSVKKSIFATQLPATIEYVENDFYAFRDLRVTSKQSQVTAIMTLMTPMAGNITVEGLNSTLTSTYSAQSGVWSIVSSADNVNKELSRLTYVPSKNFHDTFNLRTIFSDPANNPIIYNTVMIGIGNQVVVIGEDFDFAVGVNQGAEEARYAATLNGGSKLPDWISFDETTKHFKGKATKEALGMLKIDLITTYSDGSTETKTINMRVESGLVLKSTAMELIGYEDADIPIKAVDGSTIEVSSNQPSVKVQLQLSDPSAGVIHTATKTTLPLRYHLLQAGKYDVVSGSWSIQGSVDIVNTVLKQLMLTPAQNYNGLIEISIVVDDGANPVYRQVVPMRINVLPVNDLPEMKYSFPQQTFTLDSNPLAVLNLVEIIQDNYPFDFTLDANAVQDPEGKPLNYSITQQGSPLPDWMSVTAIQRPRGAEVRFSLAVKRAFIGVHRVDVEAYDDLNRKSTLNANFDIIIKGVTWEMYALIVSITALLSIGSAYALFKSRGRIKNLVNFLRHKRYEKKEMLYAEVGKHFYFDLPGSHEAIKEVYGKPIIREKKADAKRMPRGLEHVLEDNSLGGIPEEVGKFRFTVRSHTDEILLKFTLMVMPKHVDTNELSDHDVAPLMAPERRRWSDDDLYSKEEDVRRNDRRFLGDGNSLVVTRQSRALRSVRLGHDNGSSSSSDKRKPKTYYQYDRRKSIANAAGSKRHLEQHYDNEATEAYWQGLDNDSAARSLSFFPSSNNADTRNDHVTLDIESSDDDLRQSERTVSCKGLDSI